MIGDDATAKGVEAEDLIGAVTGEPVKIVGAIGHGLRPRERGWQGQLGHKGGPAEIGRCRQNADEQQNAIEFGHAPPGGLADR